MIDAARVVDVGAAVEQRACGLDVALASRMVQRRESADAAHRAIVSRDAAVQRVDFFRHLHVRRGAQRLSEAPRVDGGLDLLRGERALGLRAAASTTTSAPASTAGELRGSRSRFGGGDRIRVGLRLRGCSDGILSRLRHERDENFVSLLRARLIARGVFLEVHDVGAERRIGALGQQDLDRGGTVVFSREKQRRLSPFLFARVRVAALLEQRRHRVRISGSGGEVHRGRAAGVRTIRIGAGSEQRLHDRR